MYTAKDLEEPAHQEFETGATKDQPVDETPQPSEWFQKPTRLPSPDHDWNKTLPADHGPVQPWLSNLAREEGQQYPHDLRKPLPLIPNSRGRQVILFDHFINNDLAYLSGGVSSQTYATSVTKTKAADYGHIKWIEDLVPNTMESAYDVYYKRRITIGDPSAQGKLTNLNVEDRLAFGVSLRMFTRSIVIQRSVEDLQLGVESYQKKLNIKKSNTDGTLDDVRTTLNDRLKGIKKEYLLQTIWRQSDRERAKAMI
ncbi:hypothetical protein Tco_0909809 [Tanacetum coccineum]|uniref:Uncharacterized protein n=1 Tax=Tanacetum coccineum TaxID=301880 RepID=A0ABQ5CXD8_9ASTR